MYQNCKNSFSLRAKFIKPQNNSISTSTQTFKGGIPIALRRIITHQNPALDIMSQSRNPSSFQDSDDDSIPNRLSANETSSSNSNLFGPLTPSLSCIYKDQHQNPKHPLMSSRALVKVPVHTRGLGYGAHTKSVRGLNGGSRRRRRRRQGWRRQRG